MKKQLPKVLCACAVWAFTQAYSQTYPCYKPGPGSPVTAGTNPLGVTIMDYNNDSHFDLIIANSGNNNVTAYSGGTGGTFTMLNSFPVDGSPEYVSTSDFNNDGKMDIVTANATANNLSVLMGSGAGAFGTSIALPTNVSGPVGVDIADFNGDGYLDLITANNTSDSSSLFLNTGSGAFVAPVLIYVGGSGGTGVIARDFNGDGKPDFAISRSTANAVSVLIGDGSGGFSAPASFNTGTNPQSVTAIDFNRDGKLDLITPNLSGTASVLFGDGSGSFSIPKNFTTPAGPAHACVADLNGDAHPDIIVSCMNANKVTIIYGDGRGDAESVTNFNTGTFPVSSNAVDMNGDGLQDFVVVNRNSNNFSIFLKKIPGMAGGTTSVAGGGTVNGTAVLFKYNAASSTSKMDSVTSAPINSNSFILAVPDSGKYAFMAIPSASSLQVTYADSSTSWMNAKIFSWGCSDTAFTAIKVQPYAGIGTGAGSISGRIVEGNGFSQRPSDNKPSTPGQPIPGVIVKGGKNPGAAIFGQTSTDANGNYAFNNLPNGDYFIIVDMPGYDTTSTHHVTITGNSNTDMNFIVDSNSISPTGELTSINDILISENRILLFPNPAHSRVAIRYSLDYPADVDARIYDMVGREVMEIMPLNRQEKGDHTAYVNTSELSPGLYFVRIQLGQYQATLKLLLAR